MKNVMNFDSFVNRAGDASESKNPEIVEEGIVRKFFTGHDTPQDEKAAEEKFIKSLDAAEAAVKETPAKFAQAEKWDIAKAFLLGKASENKFRGGLRIQKGGGEDKRLFIVYDAKSTGFEKVASGSLYRTQNPLG